MDTEGQRVRFRDCTCPGTPHDEGDHVTMRPVLGFAAGAEALRLRGEAIVVLAPTGGGADGTAPLVDSSRTSELVGPLYIREGPTGWNVEDEDGPVPYDPEVILANYTWAFPIATAGDDLYSEAILRPLVQRTNATSANGRTANGSTGPSTRRTRRSSSIARSPRASSSPENTAGRLSVVNR